MLKHLKNQYGLATDEIILSTALLASAGTFVAVNVPWQDFLAPSSNMVDSLEMIEQANLEFYQKHRVWPHETTNGEWKANINALVSPEAMRFPYSHLTSFKNHIPDITISYDPLGVRHNFGIGGYIKQRPVTKDAQTYMEVILEDVPLKHARKLDRKLDGEYDPLKGRLTIDITEGSDVANVHYRANLL